MCEFVGKCCLYGKLRTTISIEKFIHDLTTNILKKDIYIGEQMSDFCSHFSG